MKIDGTSISPVGSVQATNRISQVDKKSVSLGRDDVAVSDKGQLYKALLQKAKEIPEIRKDRVEELQDKIAKGEFQIDAQKIAEKLSSQI